jgi:hypothetical protein
MTQPPPRLTSTTPRLPVSNLTYTLARSGVSEDAVKTISVMESARGDTIFQDMRIVESALRRHLAAGHEIYNMSASLLRDLYKRELEHPAATSATPTTAPPARPSLDVPATGALDGDTTTFLKTTDAYTARLITAARQEFRARGKALGDMLVARAKFQADRQRPDFKPPWLKSDYRLYGESTATSRAKELQLAAFKEFSTQQAVLHIDNLSAIIDESMRSFNDTSQIVSYIATLHAGRVDAFGQQFTPTIPSEILTNLLKDATQARDEVTSRYMVGNVNKQLRDSAAATATAAAEMADDNTVDKRLRKLERMIQGKGQPGRGRSRATNDARKPRSRTPTKQRGNTRSPAPNGKRSVSFTPERRPRSSSTSFRRSASSSSRNSQRHTSTGKHVHAASTRNHTPTRGRGRGRGRGRTRT